MRALATVVLSRVLVLVALFCGTEYAIKEGIEGLPATVAGMDSRSYWLLRLIHLAALLAAMSIVFLPAWWMVIAAVAAGAVSGLEWPISSLRVRLRRSTGGTFGSLHLLPTIGLVALAVVLPQLAAIQPSPLVLRVWLWVRAQTPIGADLTTALVATVAAFYVVLAQPANHVVRCLLGKDWDRFLVEKVQTVGCVSVEARPSLVPPETVSETGVAGDNGAIDGNGAASDNGAAGDNGAPSALRAGRVVGTLERWLLTTLVVIGQFGLIGLVLTAKSVARYRKISDDPVFAEYYLLGTMYSTLMAVIAGLTLKAILGGSVW